MLTPWWMGQLLFCGLLWQSAIILAQITHCRLMSDVVACHPVLVVDFDGICYGYGICGCSGLVVQSIGLITERLPVRLTRGPLQATLSKLLTYCVLRPTQPPTLSGTENEQQLRLWGEGLVWLIWVMVCLLAAPWVQLSVSAAAPLAHANQLPLPRL